MQKHTWNFSTVGGVKRVNIESGQDLMHLHELDQKLWTALSCPVQGLEIDHKTLALIDTDNDGHVRVPEVLAALNWILTVIKNPDDLLKQSTELPLSAINENSEEGKRLLASAKIILSNLGKPTAQTIGVDDTSDTIKIFADSRFNGDGIITIKTTEESDLITLIQHIIDRFGNTTDRSGLIGITEEQVNQFFEWCAQYVEWLALAENDRARILPLGDETPAAYDTFSRIKPKMDDYFTRCKLASFDESSAAVLNIVANRIESITTQNLSDQHAEIANYPLAKIQSDTSLDLTQGINPAWLHTLHEFSNNVLKPLSFSTQKLTLTAWEKLCSTFAGFEQWLAQKQGSEVESLGTEYVKKIRTDNLHARLLNLIQQDKSLEMEANSIIQVDQLVRYYRDIYTLLKNFVTFYDFYSESDSIFQAGTLYIDQRSCNLCIRVNDMAKHNNMVSFSGMFLIYCDCVSKKTNEQMTIVAALTNGDIDNLVVGRNALFYDKNGTDWNATVVKIIDNPISIKQAFWSPYRKISRFIETQINKFAAEQDDKVHNDTTTGLSNIPIKQDGEATKAPTQPFDIGKFVGIFAAIGLAVGAIGSVLASFVSGLLGLVWWKLPFAIAGILLVISGPSMIMAYFKLRKRNLAPILDANGWAINASVIVNIAFGNTLTFIAELPEGAHVNLNDPFMKKKTPYKLYLVFLLLLIALVFFIVWKLGYMHVPAIPAATP